MGEAHQALYKYPVGQPFTAYPPGDNQKKSPLPSGRGEERIGAPLVFCLVPIKAGSGHLQTKVRPSKADVGYIQDYFLPSFTYKPAIITPYPGIANSVGYPGRRMPQLVGCNPLEDEGGYPHNPTKDYARTGKKRPFFTLLRKAPLDSHRL